MAHVSRMYAYLVLASCFKAVFHKAMLGCARQGVEMRYRILAAVVYGRRKSHIRLVVLKPAAYRAALLYHLAAYHGYVSAVIYYLVPIVLKYLLRFHVFGVNHKSACVAVKPVHNVSPATLVALMEIIVKHRLDVQRAVAGSHR